MRRKQFMVSLLAVLTLLAMLSSVMVSGQLMLAADAAPRATVVFAPVKEASASAESQGTPVPVMTDIPTLPARQEAVNGNPVPGMAVRDEDQVWSEETKINIFRAAYDGESGGITVSSAYGDKVIAPGTADTYEFTIENNGDISLDYTLTAAGEAVFVKDGVSYEIPIQVKLSAYDGRYLAGSENSFAHIDTLDAVSDFGELSPDHYMKYTLDWQWAFEQADIASGDAYDTMLGNMAAEGDLLEATIWFQVIAEADETNPPDSGIPKTGDTSNIGLWMTLCVLSFAGLLILLGWRRREQAV